MNISQILYQSFYTSSATIKNSTFHNNDLILKKFVNFLMIDGKKSKAYKIFYSSLYLLKKKLCYSRFSKKNVNLNALKILMVAIENVKPSLDIRKVRVAGMTYLVPAIISKKRQERLAVLWIIQSAKKRQKTSKNNIYECLAQELFDAYNKQGQARFKRDELHKTAESNRAYSRYRWW